MKPLPPVPPASMLHAQRSATPGAAVTAPTALSRRRFGAAAALLPLLHPTWRPALAREEVPPPLDVPYVPTPMPVVDKMLELAAIRPGQLVYDLGCGDGRIVIAAAERLGARGIGIDIDPQRIEEAKANARRAGVADRTEFIVADLFQSNFADADAVMIYLLPAINRRLRPLLWRQLRVGTRVVSHAFDMGDEWPPEQTVNVGRRTVYAWTVNERVKALARRG
jgi:SAM-dependent methyltransferase